MPDPIVTSAVVDGVRRWGSVAAKWAIDAREPNQDTDPGASEVAPSADLSDAEVPTDATEDAADSDSKNPRRGRG